MDGIKEIFETLNSRIRNPIFGSIAIAFVTINFSELFLLFWGTGDPETRIQAFSDIGYLKLFFAPIVAGLVLSAFTPWARYLSVWIAEKPVRERKLLEVESAHKVLTAKNNMEMIRNNEIGLFNQRAELRREEIIKQAKAEDTLSEITNPEIRERAKDQLKSIGETSENISKKGTGKSSVKHNLGGSDKIDFALSEREKDLVVALAKSDTGFITEASSEDGEWLLDAQVARDAEPFHQVNFGLGRLGKLERGEFLENLISSGLIMRNDEYSNDSVASFEVTNNGIQAASEYESERLNAPF